MPAKPAAQLASLVATPPAGDDWLHELKFDGYRVLACVKGGQVRLWTRNGNDWTDQFRPIASALERLGRDAVLDGEVVVQLEDGRTSFQALQNAGAGAQLRYFVFDILHLDGLDLTGVSQEGRKEVLRAVVGAESSGPVRYSDHVVGQGAEFFRRACGARLEGIVSKRRNAPYRAGRTSTWVKVKCLRRQEFVVVGFTEPGGSRKDLGALLVATREAGEYVYRGKVGTGFSAEVLRRLRKRLEPLERLSPAFRDAPRGALARGVHWVEPDLVVEVSFTEVTSEGVLRHPSFLGIRADKRPQEVSMDEPAADVGEAGRKASPAGGPGEAGRAPRPAVARVRGLELAGVRISNPDKVLYPERGFTKGDVARYYVAVADWILPHLRDRPLTIVRCPQGHEADCFFQKHMAEVSSPSVRKIRVKESKGARDYGTVDDLAGILAMVQLGSLELHTWNSRADRLEYPDRVTLDIDPDPTVSWDGVVQAAREIRGLLEALDLTCFVKTTGGKGLHVVVPLVRRSNWDEVREFARVVLGTVAAASPDRYTLQMAKSRRKGRLLLDYLRNARGATAVEVYSTRARPGAPVSTPVSWEELEAGVDPKSFDLETVPVRLAAGIDPWREYGAVKQSLTAPLKRRLGIG